MSAPRPSRCHACSRPDGMTNCWRSSRSRRPGCGSMTSWGPKPCFRQGREDDALTYAAGLLEGDRQTWGHHDICRFCERSWCGKGNANEAYRRFGLPRQRAETHGWRCGAIWSNATLTGMPVQLLEDPDRAPRSAEGKWFARGPRPRRISTSPSTARPITRRPGDAHPGRPRFRDQGTGLAAMSLCMPSGIFWRAVAMSPSPFSTST